jgi:ATP-dependent RNA helicase MSS116, mitochondrial
MWRGTSTARLALRRRALRETTTPRSTDLFLKEATRNSRYLCYSLLGSSRASDVVQSGWHQQLPLQSRLFSSVTATADVASSEESDPMLFENLEDLHPITKAALQAQGITTMTDIQAQTWEAAFTGKDVLGRSRTGSGKTLAFILPSLERILRNHETNDNKKIQMLIISPTRELANQIFVTTQKLTARFGKDKSSPAIRTQVVYGGVSKRLDIQQMERDMPTILTATPGRLLDHLESSRVNNVPFHDCLKDIQVLVLDEMDRLLDMGFREDIQSVLSHLSKANAKHQRQTLLFSATVPPGVNQMIQTCVRPDHAVVDCIQDDDPSSHTVNTVQQSHVILPADKLVSGVVQMILHLMKSDNQHKILVFFPTTSQVAYFANLFNAGLGRRVLEIHSRISQGARTNTSERFRHAQTAAVMFTSDVSARGVDYPNVTHVLQVGAASDRETYIHRLGRTGRAGKSGQGILLLMEPEAACLRRDLKDIAIPANAKLQNLVDTGSNNNSTGLDDDMMRLQHAIRDGSASKLKGHAEAVYNSLIGYYLMRFRNLSVRRPEDTVVELVNAFAIQAGLKELPAIPMKAARQHGLAGHPALNIRRDWETGGRNFDVGKTQGGGGSGSSGQGRSGAGSSGQGRSVTSGRSRGDSNERDSATTKPAWSGWLG